MLNDPFNRHKALESERSGRDAQLESNIRVGEDLIAEENFGAPKIQDRITNVKNMWKRLQELSDQKKARLMDHGLYQLFADADDVDTWMLDTLRLVSSEDVGRDETRNIGR